MGEAKEYSKRLGTIRDSQFESVASRWNLGRFLRAEPVTSGLFGQNVFVTTSEGEFVLRGAPHWVKDVGETEYRREDRWQFTKEKYFAGILHQRTKAPVPWPMLHDEASDIFGWPYLIMPRMPGECFEDRNILTKLGSDDRRGVAIALGETLAEMQSFAGPFAGDFGTTSIQLEPHPDGVTGQAMAELREMTNSTLEAGSITSAEIAWIETLVQRASAAAPNRPCTYVHCDYKLNNLTLKTFDQVWRVTGLFDFHEARFADGALDLVRQACAYLDSEPEQARTFIESYRALVPRDESRREVMPFYVANDRMKIWAYFTRPGARASWSEGKTFREWSQPYLDAIEKIL